MFIYLVMIDGIPEYSELETQLIAFTTTILPVIIVFSVMEYRKPYGTIGKRMRNMKVEYTYHSFLRSLIRNIVKFLPWHIGHVGMISATYNDYAPVWIIFADVGFVLAVVYLGMAVFRKDHKHLADIIAGTKVTVRKQIQDAE